MPDPMRLAAWKEKLMTTEHEFFVDRVRIRTSQPTLNAMEIKALAEVDADYQLFLHGREEALGDAEAVDLRVDAPRKFYAVPPATTRG